MRNSLIVVIITYLMAALGLVSTSLVVEVSSPFLITAVLITALSLPVNLRGGLLTSKTLKKRIWNTLAIALFIYFSIDYLLIGRDLLGSAARFLTILAALKLFDLESPRDYIIFYSLVFFQILSAAATTISPLFFLIISVFIICAIWAMIIFNIQGEYETHYPGNSKLPPNLFPPSFFLATVALTVCSISITLLLFFLIPRVGIGFFDTRTLTGLKVSGFSEKITLGDFGPVKRDTTVVMRVELPGGALPESTLLYFRGQSLDKYADSGWEATIRKQTRLWKKPDNRYLVGQNRELGTKMIEQRIMLEPLDTDVIFAASIATIIEGRFPTLWTNNSGSLYLPNIPYSRIEYTAFSLLTTTTGEQTEGRIDYLETTHVSRETIELAGQIIKGEKKNNIDKALKIERYLKQNYAYTLSPVSGSGATPLDDFLFSAREGYCEHFATAMVLLLRANGIPARIVTGFLEGEWNEYGNYYLIRQQDAHSWVEADIDGLWTRFDPTPSVGLTGAVKTSTFSMFLDSLKFKWRRYIIKYSLSDQFTVARSIETRTNRLIGSIKRLSKRLMEIFSGSRSISLKNSLKGRTLFIGAFLILAAAVLLTLKRRRRRRGTWGFLKAGGTKTPGFYLDMESYLKRKGIERKTGETPAEFALRSANPDVDSVTTYFEGIRYGHGELTKKEEEIIEETLKRLKAS